MGQKNSKCSQRPRGRARARRPVKAECEQQKEFAEPATQLTDLPDALLSLVSKGVAEEERKLLRLTCKQLCSVVDNAYICNFTACASMASPVATQLTKSQQLDKAKQCIHQLQALSVRFNCENMLKYMPWNLSELYLDGDITVSGQNLAALSSLQNLTTLSLNCSPADVDACIPPMASLARLRTSKRIGSLWYLAPTLRHSELTEFHHAWHVEYLTNLQVLICDGKLPKTLLEGHSNLPLQHLGFRPCRCIDGKLTIDEKSGQLPPTLRSLALLGECDDLRKNSLPTTVTWLLLLDIMAERRCAADCMVERSYKIHCGFIAPAAAAQPQPAQLDVGVAMNGYDKSVVLQNLYKNRFLKTLRLHITPFGGRWDRDSVMSHVASVACLAARGVDVHVLTDKEDLYDIKIRAAQARMRWYGHARHAMTPSRPQREA